MVLTGWNNFVCTIIGLATGPIAFGLGFILLAAAIVMYIAGQKTGMSTAARAAIGVAAAMSFVPLVTGMFPNITAMFACPTAGAPTTTYAPTFKSDQILALNRFSLPNSQSTVTIIYPDTNTL
jgi:hypothetical protein